MLRNLRNKTTKIERKLNVAGSSLHKAKQLLMRRESLDEGLNREILERLICRAAAAIDGVLTQ